MHLVTEEPIKKMAKRLATTFYKGREASPQTIKAWADGFMYARRNRGGLRRTTVQVRGAWGKKRAAYGDVVRAIEAHTGIKVPDVRNTSRLTEHIYLKKYMFMCLYENGYTPREISVMTGFNRITISHHIQTMLDIISVDKVVKKDYKIFKEKVDGK